MAATPASSACAGCSSKSSNGPCGKTPKRFWRTNHDPRSPRKREGDIHPYPLIHRHPSCPSRARHSRPLLYGELAMTDLETLENERDLWWLWPLFLNPLTALTVIGLVLWYITGMGPF